MLALKRFKDLRDLVCAFVIVRALLMPSFNEYIKCTLIPRFQPAYDLQCMRHAHYTYTHTFVYVVESKLNVYAKRG